MRKIFLSFWLVCLVFLVGCSSNKPTPEPTTVTPEEPTVTLEPEPTKVVVVNEVDYCVDCHTDKEQLIAVSEPVIETESESSGVG